MAAIVRSAAARLAALGEVMKHTSAFALSFGRLLPRGLTVSAVALLGAAAGALPPGPARGPREAPRSVDSDCLKGFKCQTDTFTACPDIACAPDQACDIKCDPQTVSSCVPGPCAQDSDCADGMVCHAEQVNCPTPAEDPGCAEG